MRAWEVFVYSVCCGLGTLRLLSLVFFFNCYLEFSCSFGRDPGVSFDSHVIIITTTNIIIIIITIIMISSIIMILKNINLLTSYT